MMTTVEQDEAHNFSRLIEALRPWLNDIVIAGGWAHRLYRHHPLARAVDYPPLMTAFTTRSNCSAVRWPTCRQFGPAPSSRL